MSGAYTVVTDGGPNHDGTRLVRVQVLPEQTGTSDVDFRIDAQGAVRLGEALIRAGHQAAGR